jgi:hypothetical protein
MQENPAFNQDNQDPDWHKVSEIWTLYHADGQTVFYKVKSFF